MKTKLTYTKIDGTRNTVEGQDYSLQLKLDERKSEHPNHQFDEVWSPLEWEAKFLTPEARALLSDTGKFVMVTLAWHTDSTLRGGGEVYETTYKDDNGRKFTFATEEACRAFHDIMVGATGLNPNGEWRIGTISEE